MTTKQQKADDESIYNRIADKNGYVEIAPSQEMYCVGRYDGEEIKVGFREEIKGEGSNQEVEVYRSGPYKVHYNNRFISTEDGQRRQHRVKVEQANDADEDKTPVTEISGVWDSKADALRGAGYDSVESIQALDGIDELTGICGIGTALASRIKVSADSL